ncbi:plasminogen activator inhibitor 1 RNA-binding protein isoform X4 [Diabrotica virgifera virgifera]|uniref:Plasminogen activator inhibitor 1 RNA-binding protein-like isoform X4 n=1 Tax=Diabrotica virgifera virgifera TaxID=50390 RepID=A0A6P7FII0_DIAVI|nr:plasminogen activator inhibitor 1 RNA-binding protein isoform X4 [Diabrotica virgifera virgifera]
MENTYGIGIANRYALFLDDESDPLETLTLKEQEKELKKKSKVAEKENKVKTPTIPKGKPTPAQKKPVKDVNHKPQENKRDETKPAPRNNVDGKPERSFNRFNNENREERNNRRNREDRPYNGPSENRDREERPRREPATGDFENRNNRDRGERREGREGRAIGNRPGAPRGQRRNFDGDRRGKREFDRQSGSDKTEEGRPEEGRGGEEQTPVEEEPKELTLDEWKAQRAGRAKPQFNIRKAGEGEDPSQWKKMFELRKKEKDEETDEEEYDVSEYPQRVGRQKHLLDIEIQFNDSVRRGGGRGRGQRSGGPRGGGNRGGGTGGSGGGGGNRARESDRDRPERRYHNDAVDERNDARQAPKVDDERDFPSLG